MNLDKFKINQCLNMEGTEIAADITVLVQAIKDSYAGSDYLPVGEFEDLINSLEKLSEIDSPSNLYECLKDVFSKVSDTHLKAWKSFDDRSNRIREMRAKAVVGENIAIDDVVKVTVEKDSLIIGLSYFPMPNEKYWNNFLENIKAKIYKSDLKKIIIDLRGNSGGNDHFGYELAALIFGGAFNHPICNQAVVQTPLSYLIQANNFYGRNEEYYDAYMAKYEYSLELEQSDKFKIFKGDSDKTTISNDLIDIPLYILIDGETLSSGESTALCFEDHPRVQYVGQASKGCIEFGNVGVIVLPYSKLCIQISTHKNIFRDNRVFEKVGIRPHIYCETGEDALQKVLSL